MVSNARPPEGERFQSQGDTLEKAMANGKEGIKLIPEDAAR